MNLYSYINSSELISDRSKIPSGLYMYQIRHASTNNLFQLVNLLNRYMSIVYLTNWILITLNKKDWFSLWKEHAAFVWNSRSCHNLISTCYWLLYSSEFEWQYSFANICQTFAHVYLILKCIKDITIYFIHLHYFLVINIDLLLNLARFYRNYVMPFV